MDNHVHDTVLVTTFDDEDDVVISVECCSCRLFKDQELREHMAAAPTGYYHTVLAVPQQHH